MVLSTLSTIAQGSAIATTIALDGVNAIAIARSNSSFNNCELAEKAGLGAAATSTVAILILPLVGRCFKSSSTIPQKLRFTAQALQVGAAVVRGYSMWDENKVSSVGEVASTLLQEVALYKQRHLLAGLAAASKIGTRAWGILS